MTTITTTRKQLLAALRRVAPAQGPAGIRVRVHARKPYIEATSNDLWLSTAVAAKAQGPGANVIVDVGAFMKLVNAAPAEDVTLRLEADHVQIRSGPATLRSPAMTTTWSNPPASEGEEVKFSGGDVGVIRRVAAVASKDQARPILTAVCIGRGYAVATDSYRLAIARVDAAPSTPFLLPTAAVLLIRDETVLTVGGGFARWSDGTTETVVMLVEGQYPDWQHLVPGKAQWLAVVDRHEMRKAAATAAKLAKVADPVHLTRVDDDSPSLRLALESKRPVLYESEVATERISPRWKPVAFNPEFLAQGLGLLEGSEVRIETRDVPRKKGLDGRLLKRDPISRELALGVAVLRDEQDKAHDFIYILMPIRVPVAAAAAPTSKKEGSS